MITMAAASPFAHRTVLLQEVLAALQPQPGRVYCDATLGGGGHAEAILEAASPDGRLIGIDRDPTALRAASERLARFGDRFLPVHGRFRDLPALLEGAGVRAVDGIVADLGVSSPQLDRPERGFSFQTAGPIDMRMDPDAGESALALIERVEEETLAEILRSYGEERFARRIARGMKDAAAAGALTDTLVLARVIARAVPTSERGKGGKDPATRSFQALRIAVNDELREVDQLLRVAPACLNPGGRLALIAFHSLEDRIVKHHLRAAAHPETGEATLALLTRKPVSPGDAELQDNPRSRSARLRAAQRLPAPDGAVDQRGRLP